MVAKSTHFRLMSLLSEFVRSFDAHGAQVGSVSGAPLGTNLLFFNPALLVRYSPVN
jgi:hypothetical protein